MRFNDVHKQVCAALKLEREDAQKWRAYMMRCYERGLSPNAVLALTRIEIQRAADAATAEPQIPAAAHSNI